jgi:iron(III) transport system ATP-binding protein
VAYGLENAGATKAKVAARVRELLDMIGMGDQGAKYPAQLSGGQQQRVALARALATSPGLLLLDEPLSALDAKVRVYLRHEIKQLQRRLGVTTVMVTHDQEEALTMADRIVVMNHGVIEQIGAPLDIYRAPASPFVADFIGLMNFVPGAMVREGVVRLGRVELGCEAEGFAPGTPVTLAIRPEDIVVQDGHEGEPNTLAARVDTIVFLGSFFRAELVGDALGDARLRADLSVDVVRRRGIAENHALPVRLPKDRIRIYPGGTAHR